MQLQYVFGAANPSVKKKRRSSLLKKQKGSKINKNPSRRSKVAKKHGRMKAGSPAAKAWGRKMKRLRAGGGKANPKRKKVRRNASGTIRYQLAQKPKYRTKRFSYPNEEDVVAWEGKHRAFSEIYGKDKGDYQRKYATPLLARKTAGGRKGARHLQAVMREAVAAKRRLTAARKRREIGKRALEKAKAEGGEVTILKGNPMAKRRRRKHKKHAMANPRKPKRRKAKKAAPKRRKRRKSVKAAAPKRRRRRAKKAGAKRRKSRKGGSGKNYFHSAKTFRFKKARRSVRVKMVGTVNPFNFGSIEGGAKAIIVPALFAAGGVIAVNQLLLPMIDQWILPKVMPGQSTATLIASIPGIGPMVAPYAGNVAGIALGLGVAWAAKKYGKGEVGKIAEQAAIGAVGYSALSLVLALASGVVAQAKTSIGLSGVIYTPMAGADFGMAQLGSADFGIIPSGMRGVDFYPNKGMGQVQYYPDGTVGDQAYRQSEAGDMMEAEGLGIIPAGMDGADFGVIPAGLGDQGGQLG